MKRVLVVEDLPQVADHLKSLLGREQDVQVLAVHSQADAAIMQTTTDRPEVVLVDALFQGKVSGFELAKRVRAASPGTRVVMVTVPQKPVEPRPEDGIDAVFVLPGGANELSQAMSADRGRDGSGGRSIAVYSPKGGSGRTTIAVNLACVLRRQGSSVALLDGLTQFGSVRHLMEVPPDARSMVDLAPGGAMKQSLPEALWEGPGGVDVLLAPPRPEQAELVNAAELANAMGLLAQGHDYVVVDTPTRLSDDTLAILDAANVILLLTSYGPVSIANARAAVETFEMLGYRKQKPVLLVVNQTDDSGGLTRGAVEHTVGLAIAAEVPHDRKLVAEAHAKRQPFVLSSPTAQISQAVAGLATSLVSQQRK